MFFKLRQVTAFVFPRQTLVSSRPPCKAVDTPVPPFRFGSAFAWSWSLRSEPRARVCDPTEEMCGLLLLISFFLRAIKHARRIIAPTCPSSVCAERTISVDRWRGARALFRLRVRNAPRFCWFSLNIVLLFAKNKPEQDFFVANPLTNWIQCTKSIVNLAAKHDAPVDAFHVRGRRLHFVFILPS